MLKQKDERPANLTTSHSGPSRVGDRQVNLTGGDHWRVLSNATEVHRLAASRIPDAIPEVCRMCSVISNTPHDQFPLRKLQSPCSDRNLGRNRDYRTSNIGTGTGLQTSAQDFKHRHRYSRSLFYFIAATNWQLMLFPMKNSAAHLITETEELVVARLVSGAICTSHESNSSHWICDPRALLLGRRLNLSSHSVSKSHFSNQIFFTLTVLHRSAERVAGSISAA